MSRVIVLVFVFFVVCQTESLLEALADLEVTKTRLVLSRSSLCLLGTGVRVGATVPGLAGFAACVRFHYIA